MSDFARGPIRCTYCGGRVISEREVHYPPENVLKCLNCGRTHVTIFHPAVPERVEGEKPSRGAY